MIFFEIGNIEIFFSFFLPSKSGVKNDFFQQKSEIFKYFSLFF